MQQKDFFNNVGGINITDSPFFIKDNQAIGGYNYNYTKTGSFEKRLGLFKVNANADTQLTTIGLGLHETATGVKTVIRAAGQKLQVANVDAATFTDQAEDTTTAATNFLAASTSIPVNFTTFITGNGSTLWAIGGGLSALYGYTGSKITQNGVAAPTGTFTTVRAASGGAGWSTGAYFWSIALRKTSTQALSNAALDSTATISAADDKVTLTFPVGIDTTKYDKWYVYRSAVNGVTGFTTGTLVAMVDTTQATYVDTNAAPVATSQVVPRQGNTTDNATLADSTIPLVGNPNACTVFKRRLVVAYGSTVYLSDLGKDESWPIANAFTIPTGGPIRALTVVGFNTPTTSASDEKLLILKDNELWEFTGNNEDDWTLKFVDNLGAASQSVVTRARGFAYWLNYDGVYMWNGTNKPLRISKTIEELWVQDGLLDKPNIAHGWACYFRKTNQIIFGLPHRTLGVQKFAIKLDLWLTMPQVEGRLSSNEIEGVISFDSYDRPLYAAMSYLPTSSVDELMLVGDGSGFLYKHNFHTADDTSGINFSYLTKNLDMGLPSVAKQFRKVVVWVDAVSPEDLTLKYWTNYKASSTQRSEINASLQLSEASKAALYDMADWDVAFWDEFATQIKPITFNLNSKENNSQGDSVRLEFSQADPNVPVVIHGFTIFWDELTPRH